MRRYQMMGVLITLAVLLPAVGHADGCYLCQGGGHVAFKGDDTFAKRREAKEKFGCTVQGTASSCEHPKGSVSTLSQASDTRVACNSDDEQSPPPQTPDKKSPKKRS